MNDPARSGFGLERMRGWRIHEGSQVGGDKPACSVDCVREVWVATSARDEDGGISWWHRRVARHL